jgi:hypothetical protein
MTVVIIAAATSIHPSAIAVQSRNGSDESDRVAGSGRKLTWPSRVPFRISCSAIVGICFKSASSRGLELGNGWWKIFVLFRLLSVTVGSLWLWSFENSENFCVVRFRVKNRYFDGESAGVCMDEPRGAMANGNLLFGGEYCPAGKSSVRRCVHLVPA